ncbi:hypothetical protein LCGC14_2873810 [marine sediment metagenome]|uniref:Uncharacterized protein n=1 Tax=marine sediment metagenome TaxID=412755 RepID=A0A0F8Y2C0_9ZZZZ
MNEIELGDTVKCNITGFVGTAVSKIEFINGCVQFGVLPKIIKKSRTDREGLMPEEVSIDSQSLEVIKSKEKKKIKKENNGGAMRRSFKQRGF